MAFSETEHKLCQFLYLGIQLGYGFVCGNYSLFSIDNRTNGARQVAVQKRDLRGRGKSILVVDDEGEQIEIVSRIQELGLFRPEMLYRLMRRSNI